jgi:hypothetical protein
MTALRSLCVLCLIAISTGCSGVVVGLQGYNEDYLPMNEDSGLLMFQGYTVFPQASVRMQVKATQNGSWFTFKTVTSSFSPTYADGDSVHGYFWRVEYTKDELRNFGGGALDLWVRFLDGNGSQFAIFDQAPSELSLSTSCYADRRTQGYSTHDAASACLILNGEIHVIFNGEPPPPPPDDCPPPAPPDCQPQ